MPDASKRHINPDADTIGAALCAMRDESDRRGHFDEACSALEALSRLIEQLEATEKENASLFQAVADNQRRIAELEADPDRPTVYYIEDDVAGEAEIERLKEQLDALRGIERAARYVMQHNPQLQGSALDLALRPSTPATFNEQVEAAIRREWDDDSNPAISGSVARLPVCPECAEGRHVCCLDDGSSTWTDVCRCTCRKESSPASTSEARGSGNDA